MTSVLRARKNAYYDSATLMSISQLIKRLDGVDEAVAVMATDHNKQLLIDVGLTGDSLETATARDLLIAVRAASDDIAKSAIDEIETRLAQGGKDSSNSPEESPPTLAEGFESVPDTNLVLISVPGEYAAREADIALDSGRHVMMFSDNVSLDDEIRLKKKANERGLLMMGPDCGTAIINGLPLAFANVVREGPIGVVAAAGTGLQETVSLIDRYGSGISQGVGTGGRDVKDAVGGLMFLPAFGALLTDDRTRVVLLVSKPTSESVLSRVAERIRDSGKPVVVAMLGGDAKRIEAAGGKFAATLEDGARLAVEAAGVSPPAIPSDSEVRAEAAAAAKSIPAERRFLRALYTGGTLCYEALLMLGEHDEIRTNVPVTDDRRISDPFASEGHSAIDLGEDVFTHGRPHPMMEPSLRTERIDQEIADPETAVLLMDFVLGHGSHPDPVGEANPSIQRAVDSGICVAASVTGTRSDPQDYDEQVRKLRSAGVHVFDSNAQAVRFVSAVLAEKDLGATR